MKNIIDDITLRITGIIDADLDEDEDEFLIVTQPGIGLQSTSE